MNTKRRTYQPILCQSTEIKPEVFALAANAEFPIDTRGATFLN